MEAHRGARGVIQQRLDPEPTPPPASGPPVVPGGTAIVPPPVPAVPSPPEDSDLLLWERRRRWHEERASLERAAREGWEDKTEGPSAASAPERRSEA